MLPIKGFDGYYATEDGQIYSKLSNKILKSRPQRGGYLEVCIRANGQYYTRTVHRLIALTYHGDNDLQVNHKDGNKANNKPSNLEFVTAKQNQRHARDILLVGLRPVQILKGGVGLWYPSHRSCTKDTGLTQQEVSYLANGVRRSAKDYQTTMFMER